MSMTKSWWPLAAWLWFLVSPGAPEPVRSLESPRPLSTNPIQHQTEDAVRMTTLYFPDYVDGGGWSVQLVLSNVDRDAAAEGVVEVYDQDGGPIRDLFDSEHTLEIPPLGSRVLKSAGAGPLRRGWIEVETDSASVSGLLTYRHTQSGIEVGVQSVELGEQFALYVEESPTVGAGVAVFKPTAAPRVEFRLRDEEGTDPLEGTIVPWGNFHQRARTLPEWFDVEGVDTGFLGDFRGLLFLETEDDSPFAPLGLRFGKGTSSLSAVPAIRTRAPERGTPDLVFPDYVDGAGWSVQLVLSNVDPDAATEAVVEVYDPDGGPIRDLFDSESTLEIPPRGSRILKSSGVGSIRRGWVQVRTSSSSVSGLLTYRQAGTGIEVSVEPVALGNQFALFVEESEAIGAGLALFKPDASPSVELRLRDEAGNDPLDNVYVPWGNFHQRARTLPEWFDVAGVDAEFLADFRGLLFLRTADGSSFAPVGLRFGKRSHSLSAVPAIRIPEGGGIDGGQAPPPTVTLSASPNSIDRGQSATLTWSSTNAESAEITPGIGKAPTSGTRRVSPTRTTTYRITVRGADGQTATASVTVTVVVSQRVALGALFEALDGSNWTHRDNWLTDAPLGEWYGVEVDSRGRLVGLRLIAWVDTEEGFRKKIGNQLTGALPPELASLPDLRVLDLSNNQLTGPIPPELGQISQLQELYLWGNQLTGPIPPELGQLSRLQRLHLWGNQLTGPIPPGLGQLSQLQWLALGANQLTGPIPPELGQLSRLEELRLGTNQLTWPIPPELGQLSQLEFLDLGGNPLTGSLPPELGQLSRLRFLRLYKNHLMGPIPPELGQLSRLEELILDENQLTGLIPPELGQLSRLQRFSFYRNRLTGPIPPELGQLSRLQTLNLSRNQLTGPIPPSFLQLDQLTEFFFGAQDLCVSGTTDFVKWRQEIEHFAGPYCNESDRAVLAYLHQSTGGEDWTNSDGWLGDGALGEWSGVSTDSLGRVTGLDLSNNGLKGRVGSLIGLAQLTDLRIEGNALSGRLPLGLTRLRLRNLDYTDTDLCVPNEPSFRAWLNAIPSHDGTGVRCGPLSDRDVLLALYDATDGLNWAHSENWTIKRQLDDWHGVSVDSQQGRLTGLELGGNQLTGPIPPELGQLSQLEWLDLGWNRLTGPIPPELGQLSQLQRLDLFGNQLAGPIPPELGQLSQLQWLRLFGNQLTGPIPPELGQLSQLQELALGANQLTGPIPPELGQLSQLQRLRLGRNQLTGPIPPELGQLSQLQRLDLFGNQLTGAIPPELGQLSRLESLALDNNDLTGSVPPELSRMRSLKALGLAHNSGLSGTLPSGLTSLRQLEWLLAGGTELCAPSAADFQNWLAGIWKRRIVSCVRDALPMAYLTQAVQSREFPVPLVAGEKALLRVFPTVSSNRGERVPPVRARFYVRDRERHVLDIPGQSTLLPTEVDEGSLSISANAEVPGRIVQPGLEMVIEIDPDGTLGSKTGLPKRIPESGRLAVEVREMPVFDLTVIPFLWTPEPDSTIVDMAKGMAADPEGHELLWGTRTLLPIGDLEVTAHEPVMSSSNNAYVLLSETEAIHAMEGASGHYMGMMSAPGGAGGVATQPGKISFSSPLSEIIGHELGHNLNLAHAPCGDAEGLDPAFPETNGSIGAWGYDFRGAGQPVPPARPDLMSYCHTNKWISDYHFTNAIRYRLHTAASGGVSSLVAAPAKSLLLWGGVDAAGTPFLEPAFVVEAPASLPRSAGEYRIIGRTADGDELFALPFAMPEVADGDGRSSFAFVLPAQPEWTDTLTRITLSGPGGSVTLDQDTNRPVTILRNPRTGQIRAILRGAEAASGNLDATVSALSLGPGLERLTSRGIPDPEDWTR